MNSPIRVLIAEDDPQIAEIQQRFLSRIDGFECVGIAHDLDEANDIVDVLKPDLLLLDIHFPNGTGLDLLRELRGNNCKTDVILITAAKEVSTLKEALRGGVFDYILKPLVFNRLQESLTHYSQHLEKLRTLELLEQTDVDGLLPREARTEEPVPLSHTRLPKGVDELTLEKVRAVCAQMTEALNADAMGAEIGASRTTARRYLEYLVSTRELEAQVSYGSVGRPERRYKKVE